MTTPIGSTAAVPVPASMVPGVEAPPLGGVGPERLGPSVVAAPGPALGSASPGDLALLVELLQSECSRAAADNEVQTARTNEAVRKEQVQRKLEQIAEAVEKEKDAEKWGKAGEVLKWVGVAVAAVAGAAGALFTGGATAAVAAVVITAILTAQTVVKAAVDDAVAKGNLDQQDAHTIMACFGNLEDVVGACLDPDEMTDDQKMALVVLGAVDSLAKAVISCIFSGGSNVTQAIQGVTKVLAIGLETIVEAQEVIVETMKEGRRTGQLDDNALFYLQLCAALLEVCGSAAGACGAGQGGEPTGRGLAVAGRIAKSVGHGAKATTDGVAAAMELGEGLAMADGAEARGRSKRHDAMGDAATERMRAAVAQLQQILDDLEEARTDVDALLEADAERGAMAVGPARV